MPDPPNHSTQIRVELGKPVSFEGVPGGGEPDEYLTRIVDAVQAYRDAAEVLIRDRFAAVKERLPPHFRSTPTIVVLRCNDGVLVRYEACETTKPRIRYARIPDVLEVIVPRFTDGVIHVPTDRDHYQMPDYGPRVTLARANSRTGATEEILTFRPVIFASNMLAQPQPLPPARPLCLASVTNEISIDIGGTIESMPPGKRQIGEPTEQFLATSRNRLAVGWLAVELYPNLPPEHWDPSAARLWAECDLLGALAQEHARDASLRALDGRGEARRYYASLFTEFEKLLEGPEEPVHQFLKQHPELICPTYEAAWSKVPFGDRKSDFVFREPHLDYELVEIEAAHRELFRADGQPRHEVTHAVNQIADWLGYVQDNKRLVEETLGLVGISTSPRCLVVIGRSAGLSDANRRKLETLSAMSPRLRILTYDDVLAAARANIERLLGPLCVTSNMDLFFFRA